MEDERFEALHECPGAPGNTRSSHDLLLRPSYVEFNCCKRIGSEKRHYLEEHQKVESNAMSLSEYLRPLREPIVLYAPVGATSG